MALGSRAAVIRGWIQPFHRQSHAAEIPRADIFREKASSSVPCRVAGAGISCFQVAGVRTECLSGGKKYDSSCRDTVWKRNRVNEGGVDFFVVVDVFCCFLNL